MTIYQNERLKKKMLDYYIQERNKGLSSVDAKYRAVQYITLYLLGVVEHYSEWEDLESVKNALQNYRSLELYSYDSASTHFLERGYMEYCEQRKLG